VPNALSSTMLRALRTQGHRPLRSENPGAVPQRGPSTTAAAPAASQYRPPQGRRKAGVVGRT
jgi:hypothetical protein